VLLVWDLLGFDLEVKLTVSPKALSPTTLRVNIWTMTKRYFVYVIELDQAADPKSKRRCVYVGETGLMPEDRFQKHKEGGRTSRPVVRKHGIALRPDLCTGIGPFEARSEALAAERALGNKLRARGFRVFGGQGEPFGASMG
jgi:hypothetical protein